MIDFSQYPGPLRRLLEHLLAALYGITKELELTGKTLEQWFEEVKTALARFHIASYMAGKGSPFLTPQDRANIGSYLAPQIDFLENFKVQIASAGEFQRGWYNRAAQYARSIVAPYWKGKVKVLPLPAMPGDLSTPCGQLCACGWDVKPIDPENGDYDAYWILNAQRQIKTEHCQICVERARLWAPLEIREGMLQIPEGMLEKELPEHEYAELVKAVWMEGLKHLAGQHDQESHGNWAEDREIESIPGWKRAERQIKTAIFSTARAGEKPDPQAVFERVRSTNGAGRFTDSELRSFIGDVIQWNTDSEGNVLSGQIRSDLGSFMNRFESDFSIGPDTDRAYAAPPSSELSKWIGRREAIKDRMDRAISEYKLLGQIGVGLEASSSITGHGDRSAHPGYYQELARRRYTERTGIDPDARMDQLYKEIMQLQAAHAQVSTAIDRITLPERRKHLAGRHDQLSHGNWAYGPDKGGGGGGYEKPAWLEREYPLTVDPDKPGAPGQGGQSIGGFGRYVGYVDGKSGRHHIVQGELALAKGKFGVVEDNPRTYGLSGPTVAGWDVTPGQAVERIERRAQEWAEAARAREEQNKRLDQFRIHRVGKDPTQAIPSDLMNMLTRGYERASRQNASIFLQQLGMPKKSSDALLRGLSHYFSAGGSKLYNPREILNEYYKWLDSQPAEKALGPRFRRKHLQGQHNQDSHGSWAHGMDKVDRYMARLYNRPEPRFWMRSGELPGPEREAAGMVYRYWIEKPLKTPVPDSMTSPDGRTLHTKEPVPIHKILLNKLHPLGEARGEAALEYYRRRFGGKDGDPMVFTNGKKGAALRGALLHPSTRQLGTVQMTVFDADGFSGDSTYNTWADAAAEAVKMYRYAMSPAKFDAFALQDRFLEGVASTWAMQQQWAREQAEWRKEHKEAVTRADLLRHVEGLIELKHLPGKHPQERHGWRYGSRRGIAGTLRKIHGARTPDDYAYPWIRNWYQERGEYKRRVRARARGDEYARERVIREREREIADLGFERGYVIDQNGNILISKTGKDASITWDIPERLDMIEKSEKMDLTLTHNHPFITEEIEGHEGQDLTASPKAAGNSLSAGDVLFAIKHNLAEIRAVTKYGTTYILRRPKDGWPFGGVHDLQTIFDAEKAIKDIVKDVGKKFFAAQEAGQMTFLELSANYWHEVWLNVAQKYPGIEYTWEFDPGRPEPHESARDITY